MLVKSACTNDSLIITEAFRITIQLFINYLLTASVSLLSFQELVEEGEGNKVPAIRSLYASEKTEDIQIKKRMV